MSREGRLAASPQSHELRYKAIAAGLMQQIDAGVLKFGERIPSVRHLARQERASISTILSAYFWMEHLGYLEAHERSGFFVCKRIGAARAMDPQTSFSVLRPGRVSISDLVLRTQRSAASRALLPMGPTVIASSLLPARRLNRSIRKVLMRNPNHSAEYSDPAGEQELRRQIARLGMKLHCDLHPSEIVITHGAKEALSLSVMCVANRGEIVVVESPLSYETLQVLEARGARVIEVPNTPRVGVDLKVLDRLIRKHGIKAFFTAPNCNNPLGHILSDAYKAELVRLATRHGVAIVEDDTFGELPHDRHRAPPIKSFDRKGTVLLCGTFSHFVAPGFHLGWVQGGRFHRKIEALKSVTTMATASLPQLALAEFLGSGSYERHLARLRSKMSDQVMQYRNAVVQHFPTGARVTSPDGGYVLWVQLPGKSSGMALYTRALEDKIAILPGALFSATGRFKDCVRISCGHPWSDATERAIIKLGEHARELLR
jgi:DNA-binding transcriptional MocR family regulator